MFLVSLGMLRRACPWLAESPGPAGNLKGRPMAAAQTQRTQPGPVSMPWIVLQGPTDSD